MSNLEYQGVIMSKNLVGKHVRRFAFIEPQAGPRGIHKVIGQETRDGHQIIWLDNFRGYVPIEAVEAIEDETPIFSASILKMEDENTGTTSYEIHKSGSIKPNGATFSVMLSLKDTSYEKAKAGLIEYAKWRLPFLDTELYV